MVANQKTRRRRRKRNNIIPSNAEKVEMLDTTNKI